MALMKVMEQHRESEACFEHGFHAELNVGERRQ